MFEMMYEANFTYDSSMPIYDNRPPAFPYTLDYKMPHDCMIPPCPEKSYPGIFFSYHLPCRRHGWQSSALMPNISSQKSLMPQSVIFLKLTQGPESFLLSQFFSKTVSQCPLQIAQNVQTLRLVLAYKCFMNFIHIFHDF